MGKKRRPWELARTLLQRRLCVLQFHCRMLNGTFSIEFSLFLDFHRGGEKSCTVPFRLTGICIVQTDP